MLNVVTDEDYMGRALSLAKATVGLASPNPQVGCILVRDGQVLGKGAHLYDQYDHAEIVALKQAQQAGYDARGATAYVTLEPCSHHGRTGPCAEALVKAGIARCVIATTDPNPAVSGRGIAKLTDAGISVQVGVLESDARALNLAFAFSITRGRPFVTLKSGLSADGQLAPAPDQRRSLEPFFLTGPEARAEVQELRRASDALISGIGTVLADDPILTDRLQKPRRRPLMRVILDTALRLPLRAKLLHPVQHDLWIFCAEDAPHDKESALLTAGAQVTRVNPSQRGLDLEEILRHLHRAKILSVLLEAGSGLNGALLQAGLVDRVLLYYAEIELGNAAIPFAQHFASSFELEKSLSGVQKRTVGPDVCVSGLLHDPWAL